MVFRSAISLKTIYRFFIQSIQIFGNDRNTLLNTFSSNIMGEEKIKLVPLSGHPRELREKTIELLNNGLTKIRIACKFHDLTEAKLEKIKARFKTHF
jgi:hypothetical protein